MGVAQERLVLSKKIYDPVHGFIRFSPLERSLIDSYVFQRLHYIHQLGAAYLVYPGATHTRFEHSLGVMEVATQIFDRLLAHFSFPGEASLIAYWRQVIRLAALCHDLGHLPFSHLAEKRLLGHQGHEKWTIEIMESPLLRPVWEELSELFPHQPVLLDIIRVAVGEEKLGELGGRWKDLPFSSWQRVMSQVIAGDFFGADRIDYLLRDARCTGVSYGLFDYHQLIEMLRILPYKEKDLALGVEVNGIASCEALLLARHFMHRRVYQYPSVQSYSFHMARFMQGVYEREKPLSSLGEYLSYTDSEILSELRRAYADPIHPGHGDALSLFVRDNRYRAVELPSCMEKEVVQRWKDHHGLTDAQAEVLFVSSKEKKGEFSFPVLCGSEVTDSASFSEISIPSPPVNWLYLAPVGESWLSDLFGRDRV